MFFPNDSGHGRFDANTSDVARSLKDNIYFEMSHAQPWGKAELKCAVEVLGADHIIYGSSYPVKKDWLIGGPQYVGDLPISQDEKDMLLFKNAERIYGIK